MAQKASLWNTYGLWGGRDPETVLGGRVEEVENNRNWVFRQTSYCHSDWSTLWAAAGSTAPVWSACRYRPLALQHSRTLTVSFSTCCCFETYRDFDTAIKRKSCQARGVIILQHPHVAPHSPRNSASCTGRCGIIAHTARNFTMWLTVFDPIKKAFGGCRVRLDIKVTVVSATAQGVLCRENLWTGVWIRCQPQHQQRLFWTA